MHGTERGDLVVTALSRGASAGWLHVGQLRFRCSLGRSGLGYMKREGDGLTPIGRWPIRRVLFRADRREPLVRPLLNAGIPAWPIRSQDGWCDAVGDANYNRQVPHPYHASAERLWRDDELYDIVVVLGHNDRPRVQGHGSAIFMHVAGEAADGGLDPTAGCIALRRRDLKTVVGKMRARQFIRVFA